MSSGSHCTTKVKVHKPIPVVLKPSDTFPHYTPQPPRPSTSPLLSSLNSTPSPLRGQHTPSPLSGRHTPSPQSLRNSTPPQNLKNESPFNISLCDQSSARAAAEKEMRTRNHENHRTNHSSQTTPATSSRKTIISETPDKGKANSRPSIVPSPSGSSTPTQLFPSRKNTESENSRTIESENPCGENPVRNFSPESKTPSIALAESSRNFEPGVKTQREKKTLTTKTPPTGKVTHPTMVADDALSYGTGETSTAQKRVTSPERGHSSRMENANTQNVSTDPMSTRTEQSRGAQYSNAQTCSHFHEIAKIQLEYLIFLETFMRIQHTTIVKAISTINQTLTPEQFHFVADFFCNLVKENKHTENIFREACFARQERERLDHQRHMSQDTVASLRSVFDRLPDEVKTRLRSAEEFVRSERDQVFNQVLSCEGRQQKREWEVLKQQLQKQQQESLQKQQQQTEEKTLPARRSSESQKRNNGQQQQHEKTQHQSLSGYISLTCGSPNQVEISKEVKKTEQHRKQGRASEETELALNRTQVPLGSSRIQSSRQEESIVSYQQARRSELLRTPQHLEQLQSLLLQREHFYEQQRYEEVQKKMVDELFQVKDMDQKTILLQHIVQALQSQKASSREGLKSPPAISSGLGSKATESQLPNVQNKQSVYAPPQEVS